VRCALGQIVTETQSAAFNIDIEDYGISRDLGPTIIWAKGAKFGRFQTAS
jgi:hypothetical protein